MQRHVTEEALVQGKACLAIPNAMSCYRGGSGSGKGMPSYTKCNDMFQRRLWLRKGMPTYTKCNDMLQRRLCLLGDMLQDRLCLLAQEGSHKLSVAVTVSNSEGESVHAHDLSEKLLAHPPHTPPCKSRHPTHPPLPPLFF